MTLRAKRKEIKLASDHHYHIVEQARIHTTLQVFMIACRARSDRQTHTDVGHTYTLVALSIVILVDVETLLQYPEGIIHLLLYKLFKAYTCFVIHQYLRATKCKRQRVDIHTVNFASCDMCDSWF